jgi:hypothetical protein
MPNIIEKSGYVRVYYDVLTFKGNHPVYYPNRVMCTSPRAESMRAINKVGLKYRFDYQFGRHLAHPVKNNRNPQRPFLRFAWFLDIASQHRLRSVYLAFQLLTHA